MEIFSANSVACREKAAELNSSNAAKIPSNLEDFIGELASTDVPRLLIESCSPDRTVAALRDILSESGLYERGMPVRLVFDGQQNRITSEPITADALVLLIHQICRPYALKRARDGSSQVVNKRLPIDLAVMYLEWRGNWNLPVLKGISSTPMLTDDGSISSTNGYDSFSKMWVETSAQLVGLVPDRATRADALAALALIRSTFSTFPFADATTLNNSIAGPATVDLSKPPGMDESSFVAALMTSVCRPSLDFAPGILLRAPPISGSGAGKGLLARCLCIIAFGREPHAITAGAGTAEIEKRIASELMEANQVLFLDNLNNVTFRSDLMASVMTEKPSRVRLLGKSTMMTLNSSAFVILTGNGLRISEDLARRFIAIDLDARTEDPETRRFNNDIRAEVMNQRDKLLGAVLTIWRWGRQAQDIQRGRPLGGFERWCRWVRDPLIDLGCQDPTNRIGETKRRDSKRRHIAELFEVWWDKHRDCPVSAFKLHDDVKLLADPQLSGRQFLTAYLEKLAGTRSNGFVLFREESLGKWSPATYRLERSGDDTHGAHRGHEIDSQSMIPMTPMLLEPPANDSDLSCKTSTEDPR